MRPLYPLALAVALLAGCAAPPPRAGPPPGSPARDTDRPAPRPTPPPTPAAALPPPPYPTFDGTTFEPSAVAFDPASERYIVLSDKDAIVYRYELKDGRLRLPKNEFHRSLRLESGELAMKLESIARLEDGSFLAATAFDREPPEFRRVIRFRFGAVGQVTATALAVPEAGILAALRTRDPSIGWFKVEGLATTPGDVSALLAIRSVGKTFKEKRDVAWIVRCALSESGLERPELAAAPDVSGAVGREEGASSLEREPGGRSYLLLTSHENGDRGRGAHGGHLFRLSTENLERLSPPLAEFTAKPEGLTFTPDGRALIVFDDDQDWKRELAGYEQTQGLFTILALPPP